MSFNYHNAKKQIQINSNLSFLRRCRSNDLVPRGLRAKNVLKHTINCEEAEKLTNKHSKQWLQLAINVEYKRLRKYWFPFLPLNREETHNIGLFRRKLKESKDKKFASLLIKNKTPQLNYRNNEIDLQVNGFSNLSNSLFSENAVKLLNKGPSFIPGIQNTANTTKVIDECKADVLACVEKLKSSSSVPPHNLSEFLGGAVNILNNCFKNNDRDSQKSDKKTIKAIKSIPNATILPSDKTSRMIALDTEKYDEILENSTIRTGNFSKIRQNKPSTHQTYFNKEISNIISHYNPPSSGVGYLLSKVKCSQPTPSSCYALPKDHKEGPLKGRPIVAALDGPGRKLAKLLSNKLNEILPNIPSYLKDADDFIKKLNRMDASTVDGFASFDVTNLYGSIPRNKSSSCNYDLYDALQQFHTDFAHTSDFFSQLSMEDYLSLMKLALEKDVLLYKEEHFTQINGIAMGNPIAPQVAIIFMHYIEKIFLSNNPAVIAWYRYIDDVFVCWGPNQNAESLLQNANSINPHIQFTMEIPSNGALPFLDMKIFLENNTFQHQLYIKPLHSGSILPWSSHCPKSLKQMIARNEFLRAKRRSSTKSHEEYSIQLIKNRLLSNGYPKEFLNNILRTLNRSQTRIQENTAIKYLRFPFVDENTSRRMNRLLKRTSLSDKIKIWYDSGPSIKRIFAPPKEHTLCKPECAYCDMAEKPNSCLIKNIVYKISCCFCPKVYIGETYRLASQRIKEHLQEFNDKDLVVKHFHSNHPGAQIKFSWSILHRNLRNLNIRKTMEAIYINRTPKEELMNGCCGRELPFQV